MPQSQEMRSLTPAPLATTLEDDTGVPRFRRQSSVNPEADNCVAIKTGQLQKLLTDLRSGYGCPYKTVTHA